LEYGARHIDTTHNYLIFYTIPHYLILLHISI
jgi:hypothetical protein